MPPRNRSCNWNWQLLGIVLISIAVNEVLSQYASCVTPDNRSGFCVNVDNCPLIAQILNRAPKPLPDPVKDYIRRSSCGTVNNKNGLCCREPSIATNVNTNRNSNSSSDDISTHRNIHLLPTDCGQFSTDKVAGGEKASLGEFPWMVLLRYNTPDGIRHLCGASIINKRYVLTAAHCVKLRSGLSLYSVVVGEQNTETDPDCQDGTICNTERKEIFVEEIIKHENYNSPRYANDIAIVRLASDIDFSGEYVKPICLPMTNALVQQSFSYLIVSGWGTTENQTASVDLLKARLDVVPIQDCRTALLTKVFNDDQVCAKGNGIVDTCGGDSGGPLVFPTRVSNSARYVQHGIVSLGAKGCGVLPDSKPGIYVRVQKYMNWILDNMRD